MKTIVCVSGYFDPVHKGHLDLLERARRLGDHLVVIVNSDHQARLKKGRSFMPEDGRLAVVRALACVDAAVLACDDDRTVCRTLRMVRPHIFCNGGDQTNLSIPEAPVCQELGIALVDGLGEKIESSSRLTGITQNTSSTAS